MTLHYGEERKNKNTPSFLAWLSLQNRRDDPVGDLSRDTEMWGTFPEGDDVLTMERGLAAYGADTLASNALILAWEEFTRARPKKMPAWPCAFCGSALNRFDSELCGDSAILFTPTLAHTRCVEVRRDSGVSVFLRIALSDPEILDRTSEWTSAFLIEKGEDSAFWRDYASRETERLRQILRLSGLGTLHLVSDAPDTEPCFVYFIRQGEEGPIKIGVAIDPKKRKQQLQTSSSEVLHTLLVLPGDFQTEALYHSRFSTLRIRGEWFRPEPELLEFIEKARAENLAGLP